MADTLVTVTRYFEATEAHIAAGLLESEGIPVHLADINHVSANWMLGVGLGGVRVQVPAEFEAQAREVLASRKPRDEVVDHCPKCNGIQIAEKSASWKLALVSAHVLQIPLPWRRGSQICRQCGHEWQQDQGAT